MRLMRSMLLLFALAVPTAAFAAGPGAAAGVCCSDCGSGCECSCCPG